MVVISELWGCVPFPTLLPRAVRHVEFLGHFFGNHAPFGNLHFLSEFLEQLVFLVGPGSSFWHAKYIYLIWLLNQNIFGPYPIKLWLEPWFNPLNYCTEWAPVESLFGHGGQLFFHYTVRKTNTTYRPRSHCNPYPNNNG